MTRCDYCSHRFFNLKALTMCPKCGRTLKKHNGDTEPADDTFVTSTLIWGALGDPSGGIATGTVADTIQEGGGSFGGAGASSGWDSSTPSPDSGSSSSSDSGSGGGGGGGGGGAD